MFLFIFDNNRYEIVKADDFNNAIVLMYDLAKSKDGLDREIFWDIVRYLPVEHIVKLYNALIPADSHKITKVHSILDTLYKEYVEEKE